ncbi:MAG: hypothetical protein AN481_04500 [Aphanizomenon flos-aquae LD13]|jgi:hypothetical protein|uniref:Uncharacterized protein n=1 Tax=Aphanizomenon flos-aquae LD13 TaxID=1710894 RepID=A0A1B7W0B2_APHFL|nr:hypothetical protein [Aphanizomenon flos-aquae UKL13-PB]MBO1061037.1 hypothetical protein [Aphanizomenon flos-aquae CP01]OBQ26657.1 MAG: hypothetical protein AN481_04500 [Aphanizomenon flos-aquae LD13]HCQ23277.1 hypothetical protein [Anabaena sp. UBA12330]
MDFTWVKRKDCKVLLQDSTLVGSSWIVSMNECQELVLEMMALVPNKMPFYQQGLRAVMFIQQPL